MRLETTGVLLGPTNFLEELINNILDANDFETILSSKIQQLFSSRTFTFFIKYLAPGTSRIKISEPA